MRTIFLWCFLTRLTYWREGVLDSEQFDDVIGGVYLLAGRDDRMEDAVGLLADAMGLSQLTVILVEAGDAPLGTSLPATRVTSRHLGERDRSIILDRHLHPTFSARVAKFQSKNRPSDWSPLDAGLLSRLFRHLARAFRVGRNGRDGGTPDHRVEGFALIHGLTPAETEVVRGLLRGCSLAEIAKERHVRISTIRSQLSSVLAKTNCRRQSDLLLRLIAFVEHRSGLYEHRHSS